MSDEPGSDKSLDEKELAFAPTAIGETRPLESTSSAGIVDEELTLTAEPRYLPRGEIGSGGMGEVTLDLDRRIGREVAVKRLRSKLVGRATARERFLREARVQGQLEHPAVVPVYDLREDDDGQLAFTMRRVRGLTLRDILDARAAGSDDAMGTQQLLAAWRQICLAIDYAHSRGVIHRDLKPETVMLGDFGEVYVLDWGIARVGDAVGRLDGRADVYALGALLLEILTGLRLHAGDTLSELRESYAIERADRIVAACAARDVAPELAELCVRATCIERDERVASARALSDAVEQYLEGDRDLRMRRTKAAEQAEAAKVAATAALDDDEATQRSAAAREAGRALALDPEHRGARRTLLELLTRPPRRIPDEVRERLVESDGQQLSKYYQGSLAMMLLYLPAFILGFAAENVEGWPSPSFSRADS